MSATRHKSSKPSPKRQKKPSAKRQKLVLLAAITAVVVACTAVIQLILAVLTLLHGLGRALQHLTTGRPMNGAAGLWPIVGTWSDTQRVEADNPAWVLGELAPSRHVRHDVREHLEHGHPGLRGDLPPEGGLPARSAAALVARAFAAYAKGDWETCDRLVAQGRGAWGEAFTEFVAYVVSPAFSYRPADPAWDAFPRPARCHGLAARPPGACASTWPSPAIRGALRSPRSSSLSLISWPRGQVCYPRSSAALSMAASSSAVFKSTSMPNSAL